MRPAAQLFGRLRNYLLNELVLNQRRVLMRQDELKVQLGRIETRLVAGRELASIREAEFKVFSQWGEDGIIQYLISRVPIANRAFVEFGVGSYAEANTRFLLLKDHWRGLIIDAGHDHLRFVRSPESLIVDWIEDLSATSAFITRENIDDLIQAASLAGDIGLLSIDIDGNDFWVWQRIASISPRIVVVEYNSTFGPDLAVSVPYDPAFERARAHYSNLYWGASLPAFCHLAVEKGYAFVGCNSAGNNAFFVRDDVADGLPRPTLREGYTVATFGDSRDQSGRLTYLRTRSERLALIAHLPVVDVRTGREAPLRELLAAVEPLA